MSDSTRTRPLAGPSAAPTVATMLRATIVSGPDSGRVHTSSGSTAVIGRAETADVRLRDPTVSQFHVELRVTDAGIAVADLGSRNGTRIGGVLIERATMPPGATLMVGSSAVRVDFGGPATAPEPASDQVASLVGESPAMRSLRSILTRLARTELAVLITGATGTGKELAARALHAASARAPGPFVVLDCTAIPTTLAASLLFGHEKGAFTGATERRAGVFAAADGGTLFLDEVGELSPEVQPMLLRALQQREVTPVGGTRPRPIDVRFVSATWRDLRAMVNAGSFREDLYYRLVKATVRMPSLDERGDDTRLLVQHFLDVLPDGVEAARGITREALDQLVARGFPGNVRELQATVERLAMLCNTPVISAGDLMFERLLASARTGPGDEASEPDRAPARPDAATGFKEARQTVVDDFERAYLARLMERTEGNVSRAAAAAGLERQNLRALLRKHGLYARG